MTTNTELAHTAKLIACIRRDRFVGANSQSPVDECFTDAELEAVLAAHTSNFEKGFSLMRLNGREAVAIARKLHASIEAARAEVQAA